MHERNKNVTQHIKNQLKEKLEVSGRILLKVAFTISINKVNNSDSINDSSNSNAKYD